MGIDTSNFSFQGVGIVNVIKYVCRHQSKGKADDIKKAIHYCEMILERDYATD